MVALSYLLFNDTIEVVHFIGNSLVYTLLIFELMIPLLILVISWVRGVEERDA
ncbi:MAG: hypothetical protein BWY80_00726 [Firmicutes bacterium ADurb.Bin456]|nr:MAG: hypothetical protein BWY80_00726 [Firmicutes bacterium ADurb.Bin456]